MSNNPSPSYAPINTGPQGAPAAASGYPQYANNPALFRPIISSKVREVHSRESIFAYISDTDPVSQLAGGKSGDTIIFRKEARGGRFRPVVKNGIYTSDTVGIDTCSFRFGRSMYSQIKVSQYDLDTIEGFQTYLKEAAADRARSFAYGIDCALLAEIETHVDCNNRGNNAGKLSHGINLGSPTAPVDLNVNNIHIFLTSLSRVFAEQNMNMGSPYVVVPHVFSQVLSLSNLALGQFVQLGGSPLIAQGGTSAMRQNVFGTDMIVTNAIRGHDSPTVPGNQLVYKIIFGYKYATAYGIIIPQKDMVIPEGPYGDGIHYRTTMSYGYGVVYPEAVGVAYVTITAPTL